MRYSKAADYYHHPLGDVLKILRSCRFLLRRKPASNAPYGGWFATEEGQAVDINSLETLRQNNRRWRRWVARKYLALSGNRAFDFTGRHAAKRCGVVRFVSCCETPAFTDWREHYAVAGELAADITEQATAVGAIQRVGTVSPPVAGRRNRFRGTGSVPERAENVSSPVWQTGAGDGAGNGLTQTTSAFANV